MIIRKDIPIGKSASAPTHKGVFMKRFSLVLAMLVLVLALGLALVSCDDGDGNGDGGGSGGLGLYSVLSVTDCPANQSFATTPLR